MQRCLTSQGDLGAIHQEYPWVTKGRATHILDPCARQEPELHQSSGIPLGKINRLDYSQLPQVQLGQVAFDVRGDR